MTVTEVNQEVEGPLSSLESWLSGHGLDSGIAGELVGKIRGFSFERLPNILWKDAYVGLLSAIGSVGVLRVWVFVSWKGLDIYTNKSQLFYELEQGFYESVCYGKPRGLTLHLEYVNEAEPALIDESLREVHRENGCTFHGSFTTHTTTL